MDIRMLTQFFMWCTILNGGLLLLWSGTALLMPDLLYRLQTKWFPMPRETFTVVFYAFLGCFKILYLMFNVVPFLALLIIG